MLFEMYNINIFHLTAVDCDTLADPTNGQVSHTGGTTFRQTATYSCNTGYNLVGGGNRTCQATGLWSGSAPACQGRLSLGQTWVSSTLCVEWKTLSIHL